ncbi:AAA family ATPase [Chlamydiota bacterium]
MADMENIFSFHKKVKIFFMNHWVKVAISLAIFSLLILSIIGLRRMESFYRNMTLASMPVQLLMAGLHACIFVYLYMTVFRGGFSRMKKSKVKAEMVDVYFDQVIGIDEAKEESWEVVQLIKDRTRLQNIGGRILRGILLIGPPGCGKTLMAKAIATESGLPFISIAGSEFVEVFVGVGASRVRKLFKQARRLAFAHGGCIIFIDELDVIGRGRVYSHFGGQETNSTQNQLLVDLDGLGGQRENIVVIGATNAPMSSLDAALLRPGRFDRKIYIDKPYVEGREKLFRFYLDKVRHDATIDCRRLAYYTVGKSPAEIENVVKEAALIATRENRNVVEHRDISAALERVDLGMKRKRKVAPRELKNTAYHEGGHAIAIYYLHPLDDVFKISVETRSETLGVCHHQPIEEIVGKDKEWYLAQIMASLAGYAAEKMKFGISTEGVFGDFKNARALAHTMVWRLGMGTNGFIGDYYVGSPGGSAYASGDALSHLSDDMKRKLNDETEIILKQCYTKVVELLENESILLDKLSEKLIAKKELEYDEIESICQKYGKTEERKLQLDLLKTFQEAVGIESQIVRKKKKGKK